MAAARTSQPLFIPSYPGADPGEVKWVNFHPPFSEPLSVFFFLLILQILIGSVIHYYKNSAPISKSWIRTCYLLRSRFLLDTHKTKHQTTGLILRSHSLVTATQPRPQAKLY